MSADVQELRIGDIAARYRTEMHRHVFAHPDHEVGGVLVGEVDERTGRPLVVGVIPALEAIGETASVTFTHEAWELILERQEEDFPNTQIVGWYHSHPTFGIFLSEPDLFIHSNFFGDQHQFAYVVDPIERSEGIFGWRDGEIVLFERVIGFPTDHLAGETGLAVTGDAPDRTVKHAPRILKHGSAPASTGKLTIALDDLTDPDESAAPSAHDGAGTGLVVGADAVAGNAPPRRPASVAGLGAVGAAPRGPMDPRAEQARLAARRRRTVLAAAASVVLIGGVGIAVATGSGGDGGAVGSDSVTDKGVATAAQKKAENEAEAVRQGQEAGEKAFAAATVKAVKDYEDAQKAKSAPDSGAAPVPGGVGAAGSSGSAGSSGGVRSSGGAGSSSAGSGSSGSAGSSAAGSSGGAVPSDESFK